MTFKADDVQIGYPAIEAFLPTLALSGVQANNYPPVPQGYILQAEDPVWGVGEFIFAKANGTIPIRSLCTITPTWNSTTRQFEALAVVCPNSANLGKMVAVCMAEQPSVGAVNALTVGQFGWFMMTGATPINGTATVAAAASVGITAAGQIGAVAAGKQILNAQTALAATGTTVVASVGGSVTGGFTIPVANTDGFFVGGYLSGTGVGASAILQGIDRIGNVLTASVANSAAVTGNVTQTNNNATIFYNVVQINRPFAQGAIT